MWNGYKERNKGGKVMDIKQEGLESFWLWCGFKKVDHEITWDYDGHKQILHAWIDPEGNELIGGEHGLFVKPELTLDNIYKYAVPKLQEKDLIVELMAFEGDIFRATIYPFTPEMIIIERADNPTEALYKAIMQVIENETNR